MHLETRQEKILGGEEGEARQLAMEIVTRVGKSVDADALVPIKSAHVLAHYSSLHEAGIQVLEKFAAKGGKFSVPTTVDPASIDLMNWESFGVDKAYARQQFRLCEAYAKLGGIQCWTCVQYQVCNFPKTGEVVAWAESSSVVFANSIIGCNTNKISSGMDVAGAILGLTPRFGMLLPENRRAEILFSVKGLDLSELDYRSLGFFVGRSSGSRVPVLDGLPGDVTSDRLKHLGAAAAAAGPITMIHYPGITPGSPSASAASGEEQVETIQVSRKELDETREGLNQTDESPDLVAIGVPHLSATELGGLAKLLHGRTLKKGVKFYIYTSMQAFEMADLSGIVDDIEASGARITSSTDAEISPLAEMGFQTVLTDSAKMAEIVSAEGKVKMRYSGLPEILQEVSG